MGSPACVGITAGRPTVPHLAALVVAGAVMTGCGGNAPPPPPAGPPPTSSPTTQAPDPHAALNNWAVQFCQLDEELSSRLFAEPPPALVTPTADRRPLLDYLTQTSATFTSAREAADHLPPAPTAATNQVLTGYRQHLDQALADTADTAKTVTTQPHADLSLLNTVVKIPGLRFKTNTGTTVRDAAKANPDLHAALAAAPGCELYTN